MQLVAMKTYDNGREVDDAPARLDVVRSLVVSAQPEVLGLVRGALMSLVTGCLLSKRAFVVPRALSRFQRKGTSMCFEERGYPRSTTSRRSRREQG